MLRLGGLKEEKEEEAILTTCISPSLLADSESARCINLYAAMMTT
jgi:hypothetical protein